MHWALTLVGGLLVGFLFAKLGPQNRVTSKKEGTKATKETKKEKEEVKEEVVEKKSKGKKNNNKPANEEYKLVLVVRNDLGMGKGKIAAQCSHATLGAYQKALKKDQAGLNKWEEEGSAKVVVRAQDEDELLALEEAGRKANIITYIVIDAGRTQIASGTSTVLAVGPGPISKINSVTGSLKLL